MSLPDAVIDALVASGCTREQLAAAMKAANADTDARTARKREVDAARKRRQREREAQSHAVSRGQTVTDGDNADAPSPKKESSPTPPKEKTTPTVSEAKASSNTPRRELETVLDADRAGAVIDHRKRIGKPMTARAAKLLANQFAKCPDPNAAAEAMVRNGWQGFEPAWLDRQQPRAGPQQQAPSMSQLLRAIGDRADENQPEPPEDRIGFRAALPHLRAVGTG